MSGALVSWGAPLAAGSGIPEIKTYLNGVRTKGNRSNDFWHRRYFPVACADGGLATNIDDMQADAGIILPHPQETQH